jgi:uncharacterized protein YciI
MSGYFLVRQARGPAWDPSKGTRGQAGWDRHVAFIDGLADRVLIGGPIDDIDGEFAVLLVRADDETDARRLFDADPWMGSILQIASVERWNLYRCRPALSRPRSPTSSEPVERALLDCLCVRECWTSLNN